MLNQHRRLLWIFVYLSLFSVYSEGLAQSGQNADTGLSESRYVKLIDEIRKLDTKMAQLEIKITEKITQTETNLRIYVDAKTSELSKEINQVRTDVAYINGQLSLLKWVVTIVGAPILVGLIMLYFQNRKNKTEDDVKHKNTADPTDLISLFDKEIDPKTLLSPDKQKV